MRLSNGRRAPPCPRIPRIQEDEHRHTQRAQSRKGANNASPRAPQTAQGNRKPFKIHPGPSYQGPKALSRTSSDCCARPRAITTIAIQLVNYRFTGLTCRRLYFCQERHKTRQCRVQKQTQTRPISFDIIYFISENLRNCQLEFVGGTDNCVTCLRVLSSTANGDERASR